MNALIVDLSKGDLIQTKINPESVEYYLGGRGLGARYLYDNLPPNADPLGPENILGFWASPLMGTGAISMVKLCGVTKSPQTGTILMSLMGGSFGPQMRYAGYDALIFRGCSSHPVYLLINDGEAELRSAETLWGLSTRETTKTIEEELSLKRIQIASIGPGGENKVLYASIMHQGDAMGRGGIGAVMGSKNLKAIAASGNDKPFLSNPEGFNRAVKQIGKTYRESEAIKIFGVTGTTQHVDGLNLKRMYPTRNFQDGRFEDYEKINASELYDKFVKKRITCLGCAVRCRREAFLQEGADSGKTTEGPEYETLWSFGGNCGNPNLSSIIVANELCLEYGLDTISTGAVIAFAMECFEKGILTEEDTDGLDLSFGNHQSIIQLIHLIGKREGIGNILADGTKKAAYAIGNNADYYAMHVKGMELAGYEPRNAKGMALGYATSPRGGCHERGYLTAEAVGYPPGVDRLSYHGKGELVKNAQDTVTVKDSLSFCVLSSAATSMDDIAELFTNATGITKTSAILLEDGERINNLERLFNIREGFTRKDDNLPDRFVKEAIKDNKGNLQNVDVEMMLDLYYQARNWNNEGVPQVETLKRLHLAENQQLGSPVLITE